LVLDSKIELVRGYWGISTLEQWQEISPADVLKIEGVGPVTLDHIRLYLAGHGHTLRGDQTPAYWQEHLGRAKLAQQIADADEAVVCEFTILIDSAEQHPFEFENLRADADNQYRPLIVPTRWQCLGRHPDQLGDYSVDGLIGRVHVERKSIEDLQNTLLDWGGARERLEQELRNLSRVDAAMVVVEGSLGEVLATKNPHRKQPHSLVAKQLNRSILALLQDYRVPFLFCDSRDMAMRETFLFLRRGWQKAMDRERETEKILARL